MYIDELKFINELSELGIKLLIDGDTLELIEDEEVEPIMTLSMSKYLSPVSKSRYLHRMIKDHIESYDSLMEEQKEIYNLVK